MEQINVTRSSMPPFDEYVAEIQKLWSSHWLTNMGEMHNELQSKLETLLGIPHVSLYTNGHLALESIWECMKYEKGAEIITTPFTFASTTHAIVRNGLIPVFCDINSEDYTIDATKIENLITNKTVAICPVHVYGNICSVEEIEMIAKKHNLLVVYDAAHAFGERYKGKSIACYGDFSMFSFHATKVFNTIEGGCICFKDDQYVSMFNALKNFGITGPETTEYIGGNAKMNEFQAAMGLCNLRHLTDEIQKRKRIVNHYNERLSGRNGIRICIPQKDVESNYAYYPVVFDGFKRDRNTLFDELKENGVCARKYFYPLTNMFECYEKKQSPNEETPIAQYISERVLTLPLYADLTDNDVDYICDIILK